MATRRVQREDWKTYGIAIEGSCWLARCPDCGRVHQSEKPSDRLAVLLDEVDAHRKEHEAAA